MSGTAEAIASEIRALRKGRGLQAPDLDQRIGPNLRELAAGTQKGAGIIRQALIAELTDCAAQLADDLRTAVLVSLALTADTRKMPHLAERISWLASQLRYGYRTALRRVDDAERLLAEQVAGELRRREGRTASAPSGWHLEELRTVLRLDTPTPEAHEHRRIVALRDGLREVIAWMDLPRHTEQLRPTLVSDVLYGGRLVRREQPSRDRFHFVVQLPTPLRIGQSHEYGLIVRVPEDQPMRPHYVFTPECQCDVFDLRVRFSLNRLPRWVRRVEAETVRMFDAAQPGDDLIIPDEAGEVHLQFHKPTMYLGYGTQWQP